MKYTRILLVAVFTLVGMTMTASAQLGLGGVVRNSTSAAGNAGQRSGSVSGNSSSQGQVGGGLRDNGVNGDLNSATAASATARHKKAKAATSSTSSVYAASTMR